MSQSRKNNDSRVVNVALETHKINEKTTFVVRGILRISLLQKSFFSKYFDKFWSLSERRISLTQKKRSLTYVSTSLNLNQAESTRTGERGKRGRKERGRREDKGEDGIEKGNHMGMETDRR